MHADIEGDAIALYHLAKAYASDPPGLAALVRKLFGTRIKRTSHLPRGRLAELVKVHGEWRIYVRSGVAVERVNFDAGHELAHWYYKEVESYQGEDIEARCDALGAAILAPRPFFLAVRSVASDRLDVASIAADLGVTQSLAALREGEVCGTPVALVQPHLVRVRGAEWGWPAEAELRRVARVGHPSLRRVEITDEPKRVVLMAA